MTINEAVNVLRPQGNTEDDLKKAYREASKKYHPDIVGKVGLKMMQAINAAYATLKSAEAWTCNQTTSENILDTILDIWNKIDTLPGIQGEVCGMWLWISGDTRPHKDTLKSLDCKWAPKKKMWYWRPKNYKKSKKSKTCTIEIIRYHYGSVPLASKQPGQISL